MQVTNLYLFQQILEAQASLPKGDSTRDLNQLITFVLRKFFKRVKEDPFLIVEALASKARGKWKELSSYQSDEDDGMGGQKARIKEKVSTGSSMSTIRIPAPYDVMEGLVLMTSLVGARTGGARVRQEEAVVVEPADGSCCRNAAPSWARGMDQMDR